MLNAEYVEPMRERDAEGRVTGLTEQTLPTGRPGRKVQICTLRLTCSPMQSPRSIAAPVMRDICRRRFKSCMTRDGVETGAIGGGTGAERRFSPIGELMG